jgi:integrase
MNMLRASRFCSGVQRDSAVEIRRGDVSVLAPWLEWLCENQRVGSAKTLRTYWNGLGMIRLRETDGRGFSRDVTYRMRRTFLKTVRKYGLRTQPKAKPIMRCEDQFELLRTLFASDEILMKHERHRIELSLFIQLAGATGNRPEAILQLRYEDVQAGVIYDENGKVKWNLDWCFKHTKEYLGEKESLVLLLDQSKTLTNTRTRNTLPIPAVKNDPCLLLCPHVTLFALAFADDAFANPSLRTPESLFRVKINPGRHGQNIRWKDEVASRFIFRSSVRAGGVWKISERPWSLSFLHDNLTKVGKVAGVEHPTGPYTLRRGAGEAFNSSGKRAPSPDRPFVLKPSRLHYNRATEHHPSAQY